MDQPVSYADIEHSEKHTESLKREYLLHHGWIEPTRSPWNWEYRNADGHVTRAGLDWAVKIQRAVSHEIL